jgi:hypothetical protein
MSLPESPTPARLDTMKEEPIQGMLTETFALVDRSAPSSRLITPASSTSSIVENVRPGVRIIDTEGDMTFAVVPEDKKETRLFLVNSVLVRRASSSWNEIFSTINQNGFATMTITEDNLEMLEMALNIAHLRFDGVPLYVNFAQLVEAAELLHRHQLGGLLHEYLRSWCRPFIANILDPGYEVWILIAHELGWHKIFQIVARKVPTTMYMSERKYWVGTVELSEKTIGKRILGKPHPTIRGA